MEALETDDAMLTSIALHKATMHEMKMKTLVQIGDGKDLDALIYHGLKNKAYVHWICWEKQVPPDGKSMSRKKVESISNLD